MKKQQRKKLRNGVAAVEMAMVSPVFFLLVFALVEFSRMVMIKQALTNAARQGCRTAILATSNDSSNIEAQIRAELTACIPNAGNSEVCRINFAPSTLSDIESGSTITATIEVTYSDISWFPANFLGSATVDGQSTMVRE